MFVDVSSKIGPTKIEFTSGGPSWRTAYPGLCLEGTCHNKNCEAFGQFVIMNMGSRVSYQLGMPNPPTNCPQCRNYIKPETCAFNNTRWRYIGVKMTADGPERVRGEWTKADDAYYQFDQKTNGIAEWSQLVLETCKPSAQSAAELCGQDVLKRTKSMLMKFMINMDLNVCAF